MNLRTNPFTNWTPQPNYAYCPTCRMHLKKEQTRMLVQFDGREVCKFCSGFIDKHIGTSNSYIVYLDGALEFRKSDIRIGMIDETFFKIKGKLQEGVDSL